MSREVTVTFSDRECTKFGRMSVLSWRGESGPYASTGSVVRSHWSCPTGLLVYSHNCLLVGLDISEDQRPGLDAWMGSRYIGVYSEDQIHSFMTQLKVELGPD